MADVTLPRATQLEIDAFWRVEQTRHGRANFVIEQHFSGVRLEGVTVLHTGFSEYDPAHEPHALFIDLDRNDFSEQDRLVLIEFLPRGYSAEWSGADGKALRISRHCEPGRNLIPRELVPETELSVWDCQAEQLRPDRWSSAVHLWDDIEVRLAGSDPDMTLDVRFLDYSARISIDRSIGNRGTTDWRFRRLGGVYSRLDEEFGNVEPRALQTEMDDPGRVWLSVLAMARGRVWPGVVLPLEQSQLPLDRRVTGRRSDWQKYGSTTGLQIEKLFNWNRLADNGQEPQAGRRALDVSDADPVRKVCFWPESDLSPAPVADGTLTCDPAFRFPVLGVKPGAAGFTRYRPERVWTHFRGYERNALNWGGDRVFIHRGRDAWRFLFAFEDAICNYEGDGFPLLYCIPVIVQHSEVDMKRVVTFRGMPLDLQEAVWAVPGMSSALSHALNAVKFQLTKRIKLLQYSQDRFPKNHFVVALGRVHRTGLGNAAASMFRQQVTTMPFRLTHGPAAGIADVFVHLFRLAGPSTIVQRVAKSVEHPSLNRGLELGGSGWESDQAPVGQIVTRCLDL